MGVAETGDAEAATTRRTKEEKRIVCEDVIWGQMKN
jgi:hypothetical protein